MRLCTAARGISLHSHKFLRDQSVAAVALEAPHVPVLVQGKERGATLRDQLLAAGTYCWGRGAGLPVATGKCMNKGIKFTYCTCACTATLILFHNTHNTVPITYVHITVHMYINEAQRQWLVSVRTQVYMV